MPSGFVGKSFKRCSRQKTASRFMALLHVSVDLVKHETRKADVDAFGFGVEFRQIFGCGTVTRPDFVGCLKWGAFVDVGMISAAR
jgi:hypothetical protein